jgi:hypothetical protein
MTTFPASGSTGTWSMVVTGIATIAKSPAAAAPVAVAARAWGPRSWTRPVSVSGPLQVADHDAVPVSDRGPRQAAADVSAAEDPDGGHVRCLLADDRKRVAQPPLAAQANT